ncbi:hypothetical protein SJI19_13880 [Acerihabitans sp. TG2]|uniref:hypothetical protein n=1 Tax=Acerihabitans sp. TG2 TaxID=3096008 RepID=UPI002B23C81B|nr:hypothetical protein [Acerihabitans sp. TG2]MEA9391620.1 hypothetical protein [Acerihabitans sp. TG2]
MITDAPRPSSPNRRVVGKQIYENIALEGHVKHHLFSPDDHYQEIKQLGQKGKSYNPLTGLFCDEGVKQKSGIGCFSGLTHLIAKAMVKRRPQTTSL